MKKYYIAFIAFSFALISTGQVEKKVIIEHFTNTKCSTCANKNPALYQTLEDYPQVLHIAYHPSSPYGSCIFSQHNPMQNDARAFFYDVYGATPRAVVQGEPLPLQTPMVKEDDIESLLGMISDYKVTITNSHVSGDEYKVIFEVERVSGSNGNEIFVYAGLAEEKINYNAPNGEDLHHDVFRKMLYHQNIDLSSIGDSESEEIEYIIDDEWVSDQMFAYIIIHDQVTNEVLQSGSSLPTISSVTDNTITSLEYILYPNPSSSVINIRSEHLDIVQKVELYSIIGNKVKDFDINQAMDISDLPNGVYFARITDRNNQITSSRIIVGQ